MYLWMSHSLADMFYSCLFTYTVRLGAERTNHCSSEIDLNQQQREKRQKQATNKVNLLQICGSGKKNSNCLFKM